MDVSAFYKRLVQPECERQWLQCVDFAQRCGSVCVRVGVSHTSAEPNEALVYEVERISGTKC